MGVVRDVTVDNLITAVGNIDTSSLAQDSTLHDVVTAIGNISGGNDPVTNTTVNSLCKDTTGQSIASAITALGTALGNSKANISGDNIGNKATFRNNIEASGIAYEWFTKDNLGTLVSQTDYAFTFDITKAGYTPLGIVTVRLNNNYSTRFHFSQWYISGNTAYVVIRASESGVSTNNLNIGIGVLYANNTF